MDPEITHRRPTIVSVGSALPEKRVTNKDLEQNLDTTDEWIVTRTGIRERRIVDKSRPISAAHLGARAAKKALNRADIDVGDVECIICATFTPDNFFPSTGCAIQDILGCKNAYAFDISAACAGFVYGLSIARSLILSGQCSTVCVVGTEIISKAIDWSDRSTAILFGDGAGAVVVRRHDINDGSGILSEYIHSDGSIGSILTLPAWGSNRCITMNGNEVYKHAVRMMTEATVRAIEKSGLTISDVDMLIPHQANIRIIHSIAQNLCLPINRVMSNLEYVGNTSSASIPLVLDEVWSAGKIKKGTTVAFTSLGGGLAVGSTVVRF